MANFLTHSLSYESTEARRIFLKGFFENVEAMEGVRIIPNVKTGTKLSIFTGKEKITKAWAKGDSFTSATGATLTERTLTTAAMKAQITENGHAFYNSVQQELLKKGVDSNNIEGTELHSAIVDLYKSGVISDYQRQAWLGDTVKETFSSEVPTGTLDEDYKEYDGFLKTLVAEGFGGNLGTQRVQMNADTTYYATKPVVASDDLTLTGTGGTANVTINGVDYLATFDTDLTTTAANFVTSHAATIRARFGNIIVTSSGADILIDGEVPGMKMTVSITNVSSDLDGSPSATAAIQASAFKANASYTLFKALFAAQHPVMRSLPVQEKVMHVDQDIADDWVAYMESQGVDKAYEKLIAGDSQMYFRGVKIVAHPEWNQHTEDDFPNMYPNMAVLAAKQNLVFGVDGENDLTNMEVFYDQKTQDNYVRVEYQAGSELVDLRLINIAYNYTT